MSFEYLLTEKEADELSSIGELETLTSHARRRSWLSAIFFLLLGVTGGLLAAPLLARRANVVNTHSPSTVFFPDDVYGPVERVFEPDERYIGSSNETHHHWDALVAGHDAVYIANPEAYGLPRGTVPPFQHPHMARPPPPNFYVVSIMHQMHCLNLIRYHYWQVKGVTAATNGYSEEMWDAHVDHCFEYLRQAISCGAPFALEGASPLDIPGDHLHVSTVTGWGMKHECLNFEAIRTYIDQQEQTYNATWML